MRETSSSLSRRIQSAGNPEHVVRTMPAMAASGIGQNKSSMRGLGEYYCTMNAPVEQLLFSRDADWQCSMAAPPWPSSALPGIVFGERAGVTRQRGLICEYLLVTIFHSCAESLASENANRPAVPERADSNIHELLEEMIGGFHPMRQSDSNADLFDVVAGFEALGRKGANP